MLKIGLSALLILLITVSYFVFALPAQVQSLPDWDIPRLDELYMVEAYPASVMMAKATTCDIDTSIGNIVPGNVLTLEGMGWTVTMNPGFHMCYLGFNCRDVAPPYAPEGQRINYHNRLPGFNLYPLNISSFRLALQHIVGCEKDAWLASIYQFINVRLDQCVPPANEYWFNPYIPPYPEDWTKAEEILIANGFTWDKGADTIGHTTDDIWYMPNGDRLIGGPTSTAPGSERWAGDAYGIYVMCPSDALAPQSHLICRMHTKKWNNFFMGGVEVDTFAAGGLFQDEPEDYAHLLDVPFYQRDHDIYMLCWGLGRTPDYLFSFFHSSQDIADANNSPGLVNADLDRMLFATYYWRMEDWELLASNNGSEPLGHTYPAGSSFLLPYPLPPIKQVHVERVTYEGVFDTILVLGVDYTIIAGKLVLVLPITLYSGDAIEVIFNDGTYTRLITDIAELRNICWLLQWKLWYLDPYCPIYSRNYIDIFKGGLESWVDSRGYGAGAYQLEWTFLSIHWTGAPVGGTIKWHVGGSMQKNHPLTSKWVYDATLLNRIFEGLLNVNPYTHADMPWVALKYEILPWTNLSIGVKNGMKIKFWLRDDVYWQDGAHVTAADCKFSWDFLASINEPNFYSVWDEYVKSEVINDYLVEVYDNATGLWDMYGFSGSALMFPSLVWAPYMGDYDPSTGADLLAAENYDISQIPYQTATGSPPPVDKPTLTALYGTNAWWLDYWNKVTRIGHLYKDLHWWVRAGTKLQQCTQLAGLYVDGQCSKVVGDEIIPKVTRKYLDIVVINVNTKATCTFNWELIMDGSYVVGTGGPVTLDAIGDTTIRVKFAKPKEVAPCVHTFTVRIITATGINTYTLTAAVTFCDMNCDCKVDIKDLVLLIKCYGTISTSPRWNANGDFNGDGKIDIKDLVNLIGMYGKFCGA
jgi:ABC-type transport system substrate-binding protein